MQYLLLINVKFCYQKLLKICYKKQIENDVSNKNHDKQDNENTELLKCISQLRLNCSTKLELANGALNDNTELFGVDCKLLEGVVDCGAGVEVAVVLGLGVLIVGDCLNPAYD